ncbi:MAG TPA: pseudouridine synthase [Clostridia bacterium]|nr:pseudouridine synthase [Clostridia bacterium]
MQDSSSQHNEIIRLDKFISNQRQEISRSQVKLLLKRGLVTVNDTVVRSADLKVNPFDDVIKLEGEEISFKKYIYIMLNKPQGVVCSTRDGLSPTVLSLVPPHLMRRGLFPAGRLDKDTEGFVLITDDGELAHKMLSPKNHVQKLYYVNLQNDISDNYKNEFEKGITLLSGEECQSAEFYKGNNSKECYVVLHEGMFHQVKKMFEALGNKVVFLKRMQIGALKLDENLKPGECLEILHKNVEKLLEFVDFKDLIN